MLLTKKMPGTKARLSPTGRYEKDKLRSYIQFNCPHNVRYLIDQDKTFNLGANPLCIFCMASDLTLTRERLLHEVYVCVLLFHLGQNHEMH